METTKLTCDINKCDNEVFPNTKLGGRVGALQVIFTTEQTEGRSTEPYLAMIDRIDLCQECLNKILKGNYIFAEGAMGYNTYHL